MGVVALPLEGPDCFVGQTRRDYQTWVSGCGIDRDSLDRRTQRVPDSDSGCNDGYRWQPRWLMTWDAETSRVSNGV